MHKRMWIMPGKIIFNTIEMDLQESGTNERQVLVKSGELHISAWLFAIVHKVNPFRLVFYICRSFDTGEDFLVNPDDVVEVD